MNGVKNCPFCGSGKLKHEFCLSNEGYYRYLRCQNCNCTGGYVSDSEKAPFTEEEVVRRWNRRVSTYSDDIDLTDGLSPAIRMN